MATRVTPYEVVLEPLEAAFFPAIREEAEHRGTDPRRRDQFLLLGHVGALLRETVPDEAPADAIEEYAELLYQGFQFWSFGRRLYAFDQATADHLTTPRYELHGWELAAPPACYLQLPAQRLWARVSAEAPFEPVDGCFVTVDDTAPAPGAGAHLRLQLVLGFRVDRPGLSLISYRTDLDPGHAAALAEAPWREEGEPFSSIVPGGERMGLRMLATTSEMVALALRALAYLDRHSRALLPATGSAVEGETHLEHTEVRLALGG